MDASTSHVVKKRRQHIYSSDEEFWDRPSDVMESQASSKETPLTTAKCKQKQAKWRGKSVKHDSGRRNTPPALDRNNRQPSQKDIPCSSSSQNISSITSENKTLIRFTDHEASPWDSDAEMDSDTSTPAFKRGRHQESSNQQDTRLTTQAVKLILEEGMGFKAPDWMRRRAPKRSVLILVDTQLKYWPAADKICEVIYHKNWPPKHWNQVLRLGAIQLGFHSVVLYLEANGSWQDVPPIKNSLTVLCKTIRSLGDNPRIFVSNHLPRSGVNPVGYPVAHSNFILQQAIRSTSRALKGGVFKLSLYEHFISKRGKVLRPQDQIFMEEGTLTWFGCLIFWECLMRETGLKGYWFSGSNRQK